MPNRNLRYAVENSATTTDAAFTYLAEVNNPSASFATNYYKARVVSCSLEVEFSGNSNSDQGRLVSAYVVCNEFLTGLSLAAMLSSRQHEQTRPIEGTYITFKPIDSKDLDFVDVNPGLIGTSVPSSDDVAAKVLPIGSGITAPINVQYEQHNFFMYVHVTGGAANTAYRCKLIVNWEAIPSSQIVDIPMLLGSVSPADPVGLAQVQRIIAGQDQIHPLTTEIKMLNDNNVDAAKAKAFLDAYNKSQLIGIATGLVGVAGLGVGYALGAGGMVAAGSAASRAAMAARAARAATLRSTGSNLAQARRLQLGYSTQQPVNIYGRGIAGVRARAAARASQRAVGKKLNQPRMKF